MISLFAGGQRALLRRGIFQKIFPQRIKRFHPPHGRAERLQRVEPIGRHGDRIPRAQAGRLAVRIKQRPFGHPIGDLLTGAAMRRIRRFGPTVVEVEHRHHRVAGVRQASLTLCRYRLRCDIGSPDDSQETSCDHRCRVCRTLATCVRKIDNFLFLYYIKAEFQSPKRGQP